MSWCCSPEEPEQKYQVRTVSSNEHGEHQETVKFYNSLEDIDPATRENANASITKVKTQLGFDKLREAMVKNKEKFTDNSFPANSSSLGHIEGNISWKRIPEIMKQKPTPVLFDKNVEPSSVIAGHEGSCYLLSSIAALAEFPSIIKGIFHGQQYNPEGIYKVSLRTDGVVEEVVVDDFVPVNDQGHPLFCKPNKRTGQFWVSILEKALAKVSGSYANLNEGVPSDIFRAVAHATSNSQLFTEEHHDTENVWSIIKENTHNHYPCCASTKQEVSHPKLQNSHTYTIISAQELHTGHGNEKVIKLRNPWKQADHKENEDHTFWDGFVDSAEKTSLRQINNGFDYGLFYIPFKDFVKNFNQIHYCNLNTGGKFLSQSILLSNKASFFDVAISNEDIYTFELSQSSIKGQTEQEKKEEYACRSTILLIKVSKNNETGVRYEFINGVMKYEEANTVLTEKLAPGNYVVYAKVDPTVHGHKFPQSAILSLNSKSLATLQAVLRTKYPSLVHDALLDHAFHNKKQELNDKRTWISWQLFFQKGGVAYIAIGNHQHSEHEVTLQFHEEQFTHLGFKLKKPHKGCVTKKLHISPGQSDIIIARAINNPTIKTLKFPPKLDLKLQPLPSE